MEEIKITILEDLGFDGFFSAKLSDLDLTDHVVARVVTEYREAYKVRSLTGEYLAKITGKQQFLAVKRSDYPAVGDFVIITELPEKKALIHKVLLRKTVLNKYDADHEENQLIATNIDTAFIVGSPDRDYSLNRFERYLVLAKAGGISPVIIINKTDILSEIELQTKIADINNRFTDIAVLQTSTITESGLADLEKHITRGKTYCFIGSSGVGKSTLINKLLGTNAIKTLEISDTSGRGKHTTSAREIYFLKNGGIVIDNPGTREVGLSDTVSGVENVFDEISLLSQNCRFPDCAHTLEPDCAILKALETGTINVAKYENYLKLRKETEFNTMTAVERRAKDRKFGKFIKKAKDSLKDY